MKPPNKGNASSLPINGGITFRLPSLQATVLKIPLFIIYTYVRVYVYVYIYVYMYLFIIFLKVLIIFNCIYLSINVIKQNYSMLKNLWLWSFTI